MTKKHFNALALALASTRPQAVRLADVPGWHLWDETVEAVADVCAQSSPRFDRDRFVFACEDWHVEIREGELRKAA